MVSIGQLSERLTIQQKTTTDDGQGGRAKSWATLATVWGSVVPVSMGEKLQAAAIGAVLAYKVTLRYRADVTPQMRVLWTPFLSQTTKTLEIHGVQPMDGERSRLSLDCSEVI